jgi:hypothetical protein
MKGRDNVFRPQEPTMLRRLAITVIALLCSVPWSAAATLTPWAKSMSEAQANSRKAFKPIIVYCALAKDGNSWKMRKETLEKQEMDEFLNRDFACYRADFESADKFPSDVGSHYSKLKPAKFPIVLHIAPDGKTLIKSTQGLRDLAAFKSDLVGTLQSLRVSAAIEKSLADKLEKAKAAMAAKDHPTAIKLINEIEKTRGWSDIKKEERALDAELDQIIADILKKMLALTREGKFDEALEMGKNAEKEFKASTSESSLKMANKAVGQFSSAAKATNKGEKEKLYKAIAKDAVGTEFGDLALIKMQE